MGLIFATDLTIAEPKYEFKDPEIISEVAKSIANQYQQYAFNEQTDPDTPTKY